MSEKASQPGTESADSQGVTQNKSPNSQTSSIDSPEASSAVPEKTQEASNGIESFKKRARDKLAKHEQLIVGYVCGNCPKPYYIDWKRDHNKLVNLYIRFKNRPNPAGEKSESNAKQDEPVSKDPKLPEAI